MNKRELVSAVAEQTGRTKSSVEESLNAFLLTIGDSLSSNDDVQLIGFGRFDVVERPARIGRNPSTGAELKIKKKKVVRFKAGSDLQDKVN